MKKSNLYKLTFLLLSLSILASCGASSNKKENITTNPNEQNESLENTNPDIANNQLVTHEYFETNPSKTFVLSDMELLSANNQLDHVEPQIAAGKPCEHVGGGLEAQGVHLNFNRQAIEGGYLVEVFAPADGRVYRVDTCVDTCNENGCTRNTQYSIILEIAKHKDDEKSLLFQYSFEPMTINKSCMLPDTLENVEANSSYADLIYVKNEELVKKGDRIAHFWIPEDPNYTLENSDDWNNNAHIHMNIRHGSVSVCPNIFTNDISTEFSRYYNNTNRTPEREMCASTNNYSGICGEDELGISNFYTYD